VAFAGVQAPRLSSVDIADAVLFDDGPAVAYLSSVERSTIHWTAELRSVQTGVRDTLWTDPSGYYRADFATAMQSGDPRLVQQALQHLGTSLRGYLETRYGPAGVDNALRVMGDSYGNQAKPGRDLDSPVLVIVVVLLVVVVFAAPTPELSEAQTLASEKFVNQVATALRVAR
jgi:hypothetical protein